MKKIMILSLSVLLVLAIGFLVISHYISEKEKLRIEAILQEGERINEKSNLGLTFLEEKNEIDGNSVQNDQLKKSPDIIKGDSDVCGYYGKLDQSEKLYLTYIEIYEGDYHVFNVKVGDDLQQSINKLIEEGYEVLKIYEGTSMEDMILEKDGVGIRLLESSDGQTVKNIFILLYDGDY